MNTNMIRIAETAAEVKPPEGGEEEVKLHLRMPEVILQIGRQGKGLDPRIKAFWTIIARSALPENNYIVQINLAQTAPAIGVTDRTLKNWLAFMEQHKLLKRIDHRGGRHRGVKLDVIWVRKGEELAARRLRAEEAAKTDHIPPNGQTMKLRHKSYISTLNVVSPGAEGGSAAPTQPPADLILDPSKPTQKRLWNLMAMRFREEIERHPLSVRDQHILTAVLLSRLKGKMLEYARALYYKLRAFTGRFHNLKEAIIWLVSGRYFRERKKEERKWQNKRQKRERPAIQREERAPLSEEDHEARQANRKVCRVCGEPLVGGHVEGMCWSCFYQKLYSGALE